MAHARKRSISQPNHTTTMATKVKTEQTADSLKSRIYLATLLPSCTTKDKEEVVRNYFKDVAALAGFSYSERPGSNTYVVLTGHGVVLTDWISAHELVHNFTGEYPADIDRVEPTIYQNGHKLAKPSIRLTASLTPRKAADILLAEVKAVQAYTEAVKVAIADIEKGDQLKRQIAAQLVAVAPGCVKPTNLDTKRPDYIVFDVQSPVKYSNYGKGRISTYLNGTVSLELNNLPNELAHALLATIEAYKNKA